MELSLQFFWKVIQIFELKSVLLIIYHWTPPLNITLYLKPVSISVVKLCKIPVCLLSKLIPWAMIVSAKLLSNNNVSTGSGFILYFSYIVSGLKPRSHMLSLGMKLNGGNCLEILTIIPRVNNLIWLWADYRLR